MGLFVKCRISFQLIIVVNGAFSHLFIVSVLLIFRWCVVEDFKHIVFGFNILMVSWY